MISLGKGQSTNLTKDLAAKKLDIGLGWKTKMDLDMIAILLGEQDKLIETICHKDEKNRNNSVRLIDDEIDGGDGKNEIIQIDLDKMSQDIKKIAIYVNIFKFFGIGSKKFSDVEDACIKVVNRENSEEILKYDLDKAKAEYDALHFADLVEIDGSWELKIIAEPCNGSVDKLVKAYK